MNANGKIGAMGFTPAASRAALRLSDEGRSILVDSDAFARAEGRADAARFAPSLEDIDIIPLLVSGGYLRGFLRFLLRGSIIWTGVLRGLMALPVSSGEIRFH